MDPKGKGMVVNDKEKESIFNEPRDDKAIDSGSSQKKKDGKKNCWGRASVRRRSHAKKQLRLKPSQGGGRRFLLWSFGITNRHRDRMTFLSIVI
jgi:hypothetical protein